MLAVLARSVNCAAALLLVAASTVCCAGPGSRVQAERPVACAEAGHAGSQDIGVAVGEVAARGDDSVLPPLIGIRDSDESGIQRNAVDKAIGGMFQALEDAYAPELGLGRSVCDGSGLGRREPSSAYIVLHGRVARPLLFL